MMLTMKSSTGNAQKSNRPRYVFLSVLVLMFFVFVKGTAVSKSTSSQLPPPDDDNKKKVFPLVSVILPTYKRSKLLHRALEQLSESAYENLEVVIVDDSPSAPENVKKLQSLMKEQRHQTIVYHHSKERMSIGTKRNLAIDKLSTGEYLIQVDDDDLYSKDRIEYQVRPLIEGRAQLTVLEHDKWMVLRNHKNDDTEEGRIQFYDIKSFHPTTPHYGTIAFSRQIWKEANLHYPDTSFAEDKAVWKQAVDHQDGGSTVQSLPNQGHHAYVRHGHVTNPTYDELPHPKAVPMKKSPPHWKDAAERLSRVLTPMSSGNKRRKLQQGGGTCGCCINANVCLEYEQAWDLYGCTYYEPNCGSGEESPGFFENLLGPCDICPSAISCADKYGSFDACPGPSSMMSMSMSMSMNTLLNTQTLNRMLEEMLDDETGFEFGRRAVGEAKESGVSGDGSLGLKRMRK